MTARRIGLATLIAVLAAPAVAQAATFTLEGLPYAVGDDPYGVVAQDFNSDGLVDVATVNGTGSTLSVLLRQPTGGFTQEAGSPFATGPGPNYAATADFNADGRPDVAVSNFNDATVTTLLRQAGGGFAPEGTSGAPGQTRGVVTADFNADGRPDLAAVGGNLVAILLRQPNGGFAGTSFGANPGANHLSTGDLDGDGDADLAIANDSSGGVTTLYNNGAASFSQGSEFITTGARPLGTAIGDFNGDRRNDIAVANTDADTVSVVLRNAANTGWEAPVSVPDGPIGLAAADFDSNGRTDLAVASNGAGAVTILSGGTVAETPTTVARAYGLAVGDFNNDRKPDLAISSDSTQDTLSVLLNTTPTPQQPPVQTPTPTPTATPVAPPVAGRSVNATPVSGKVKVKLPGSKNFVDLSEAANLPVGTTVDTRDGKVTILAAGKGGKADFFDGLFKISQTKGSKPLTTLTLTETLSCPQKGKAAAAAAKKKSRKLWGDGKGSFRTTGKYAAATVRGTKWLVTDRCDTTTVKVTQGVVRVRDNVKRRNVTVRKGSKPYVARAKKR